MNKLLVSNGIRNTVLNVKPFQCPTTTSTVDLISVNCLILFLLENTFNIPTYQSHVTKIFSLFTLKCSLVLLSILVMASCQYYTYSSYGSAINHWPGYSRSSYTNWNAHPAAYVAYAPTTAYYHSAPLVYAWKK